MGGILKTKSVQQLLLRTNLKRVKYMPLPEVPVLAALPTVTAGQANFRVDSYPMMSYRKEKGGLMAVDFEALDLVRSQNRSRSYNKRLEGLQQQVTELGELVADAIACVVELEKPSHVGRSTTLKERFQKIKKRG